MQKEQSGQPRPMIGKGWNIVRLIIAHPNFMPKYYDELEACILPLFAYI